MDTIQSPIVGPRVWPIIEQTAEGLRIEMRPPRPGCVIAFLGVWLVMWTFGGVTALRALLTSGGELGLAILFLLLWLAGWAVGELAAAAFLAFMINGREIIMVDGEKLTRRAEAFGRGLTWRYPLAGASNFRQVSASGGEVLDLLAFDSAGKTIRMGSNLYESNAQAIAEAVWRQAPSLRPKIEQGA